MRRRPRGRLAHRQRAPGESLWKGCRVGRSTMTTRASRDGSHSCRRRLPHLKPHRALSRPSAEHGVRSAPRIGSPRGGATARMMAGAMEAVEGCYWHNVVRRTNEAGTRTLHHPKRRDKRAVVCVLEALRRRLCLCRACTSDKGACMRGRSATAAGGASPGRRRISSPLDCVACQPREHGPQPTTSFGRSVPTAAGWTEARDARGLRIAGSSSSSSTGTSIRANHNHAAGGVCARLRQRVLLERIAKLTGPGAGATLDGASGPGGSWKLGQAGPARDAGPAARSLRHLPRGPNACSNTRSRVRRGAILCGVCRPSRRFLRPARATGIPDRGR